MTIYRKTKYIQFVIAHRKPKTVVINVINNGSSTILGQIAWYGAWRQYTFNPYPSTVFNNECLKEIQDVLTDLNTEHKKGK